MDRLGEDGVGREEEHPGDLVGDDATFHGGAGDDCGPEEQPAGAVEDHAPPRVAEDDPHPRVAARQAGPEPEARARDMRRARMPTKAITPPVPATTSSQRSPGTEVEAGVGPRHRTEGEQAATITTVLPIGAAAVTAKRRWAYSTAVAMAPAA